MKLELKKKLVIKDFEQFLQMYEDAEDFIKEHLDIDELGIDEDKNAQHLINKYFENKEGLFILLHHQVDKSVMVLQIQVPHYIIHGPYEDMSMLFGNKYDTERFYVDYCRKNYDDQVQDYIQAKVAVEENFNDGAPIKLFKPR